MRLTKSAYALRDQGVNVFAGAWIVQAMDLADGDYPHRTFFSPVQKLASERKDMQPRRMRRSLRYPPGVHRRPSGSTSTASADRRVRVRYHERSPRRALAEGARACRAW
jgi:hypothetical protein